jgi:hypothetical protein
VNRAWARLQKRKETFKEEFSIPGVPVSVGLREKCKECKENSSVNREWAAAAEKKRKETF